MMKLCFLVVLCVALGTSGVKLKQEPTCRSQYDRDFEMLKDIVDLKKITEELQGTLRRQADELARINVLGEFLSLFLLVFHLYVVPVYAYTSKCIRLSSTEVCFEEQWKKIVLNTEWTLSSCYFSWDANIA